MVRLRSRWRPLWVIIVVIGGLIATNYIAQQLVGGLQSLQHPLVGFMLAVA